MKGLGGTASRTRHVKPWAKAAIRSMRRDGSLDAGMATFLAAVVHTATRDGSIVEADAEEWAATAVLFHDTSSCLKCRWLAPILPELYRQESA